MTSLPLLSTQSVVSMTCEKFVDYVSDTLRSINDEPIADDVTHSHRISADELRHNMIRDVINTYLVPSICVFGVVGNLLNLVVLTRKRLQRSMKHLERSVTSGLAMLAISDMMFCLAYLVFVICGDEPTYQLDIKLYIQTYKEPVMNIFLLISTWLTVVLAIGRYIAVCRPLHARWFINIRGTRIAIAVVFIGSFLVNLPRFWHYQPLSTPCHQLGLSVLVTDIQTNRANVAADIIESQSQCDCYYHMKMPGQLFTNPAFISAYHVTCAVFAIFIPVSVLIVCNWCLVRALRRSTAMQQRCCRLVHAVHSGVEVPSSTGHCITPTLIALIILFVTLVVPSEILTFLKQIETIYQHTPTDSATNETVGNMAAPSDSAAYFRFRSAVDVTNCLLLVNFSFNVVLYCIINAHFRRVMHHVICAVILRRRRLSGGSAQGTGTEVVTMWMRSTQNYRATTEADLDAL